MANDIYGTITSVEDDDYQGKSFKKVTLGTGEVLKVKYGREGALKDKWPILGVGVAIHFKMKDFMRDGTAYPFVDDIEVTDIATVASELPDPVKVGTVEVPGAEPKTIAPQERGMWWKQLGDDLRSGHVDISKPFGKTLRLRYFAEMFRVLDIEIEQE